MTNWEWLYELAHEDPHALAEWFATERELQARVDELKAENDELREKLSQAIGHAVDILALQDLTAVDMEGVVEYDNGKAVKR